jgi:hypothetical protein
MEVTKMKRTRRIVLLSLAALALIVTGMQIEKAVADQSTARLEMLQPQWWDVVNADGFPIIARSGNWPTVVRLRSTSRYRTGATWRCGALAGMTARDCDLPP